MLIVRNYLAATTERLNVRSPPDADVGRHAVGRCYGVEGLTVAVLTMRPTTARARVMRLRPGVK
jgi:hypothetical protein